MPCNELAGTHLESKEYVLLTHHLSQALTDLRKRDHVFSTNKDVAFLPTLVISCMPRHRSPYWK